MDMLKHSATPFQTHNLDSTTVVESQEVQRNHRVSDVLRQKGKGAQTNGEGNRVEVAQADSRLLPKYSHKLLISVCQPRSTSQPQISSVSGWDCVPPYGIFIKLDGCKSVYKLVTCEALAPIWRQNADSQNANLRDHDIKH